MKVTKINSIADSSLAPQRKLRVAAYCRVSTDSTEQLSSLENQRTHYTAYIKSNSAWDFVGLYFDEGVSATKKDNRNGLLDLIRDCENRKVDLIVTKSISRFARNTKDCLEIVRKMTDLSVSIIFEKENINTGTMDSELILSILSSLAAEESVSISKNNKWSVKKRFQNGTYKLGSSPYGYDYDGKTLIPNPEQAPIVKRIFAEVLAGSGTHAVANRLNDDGILAKRGGAWSYKSVRAILENEKYIGDALFQKSYTDDSFTRRKNNGEEEQYYVTNHHEAIISREDFVAVDRIIMQHGKEKGIEKGSRKYGKRYAFSSKIICGECGGTFKRRIHMKHRPSEYIAWCCNKHIDSGGTECSMIYIREDNLKTAFVTMMNRLYSGRNVILKPLIAELKNTEGNENNSELLVIQKQIRENSEQVQVLTGLMSKGYLEPALFNEKYNLLQMEITKLKDEALAMHCYVDGERSLLHEAEALLKHLNKTEITEEYSDEIFVEFADGITVLSPTEVGFQLKCGLFLKERMVR